MGEHIKVAAIVGDGQLKLALIRVVIVVMQPSQYIGRAPR